MKESRTLNFSMEYHPLTQEDDYLKEVYIEMLYSVALTNEVVNSRLIKNLIRNLNIKNSPSRYIRKASNINTNLLSEFLRLVSNKPIAHNFFVDSLLVISLENDMNNKSIEYISIIAELLTLTKLEVESLSDICVAILEQKNDTWSICLKNKPFNISINSFLCYLSVDMQKNMLLSELQKSSSIAASSNHVVFLTKDRVVVAKGRNKYLQCSVETWSDIEAVFSGNYITVGVKSNGRAIATDKEISKKLEEYSWNNLVSISVGDFHVVGLRMDGSVVAIGSNNRKQCNVEDWSSIKAISAGDFHTVGLKEDGSTVAVGSNSSNQCKTKKWKNIKAISAGKSHTVGLKMDGSVVAVGKNDSGQCNVKKWFDIKAIFANHNQTIGIRHDNSIVVAGHEDYISNKLKRNSNIRAIAVGPDYIIGLKEDGSTLLSKSKNWKTIKLNIKSWPKNTLIR